MEVEAKSNDITFDWRQWH